MCCHAGFWPGGAGRQELSLSSGVRRGGGRWESLSVFCCFVLCILLICIVVVPVPFIYCSVKLPLSRPTSFCLFLSILLRAPAGGGAAHGPFVAGHSQTITQALLIIAYFANACLSWCYHNWMMLLYRSYKIITVILYYTQSCTLHATLCTGVILHYYIIYNCIFR